VAAMKMMLMLLQGEIEPTAAGGHRVLDAGAVL